MTDKLFYGDNSDFLRSFGLGSLLSDEQWQSINQIDDEETQKFLINNTAESFFRNLVYKNLKKIILKNAEGYFLTCEYTDEVPAIMRVFVKLNAI